MTPTEAEGEEGARLLAEWINYDWDGLREDGARGFPQWAHDGIGALRYQGGKQGLRNLAKAIAAAETATLTRQLAEANKRAEEGWRMFEANAAATAAATNRALLAEEQLAEVRAERERIGAPLGWNTTSNARLEVKLRDYRDNLRGQIGSEIEALIKSGQIDEYYALGCAVVDIPIVKSLIEFAARALSPPREESGEPR